MKRIAIIDKSRCRNKTNCEFLCGKACPINRKEEDCIVVDSKNKAEINENLCIGCNICAVKCPFDCIKIINLPEKLKEDPIHRYGKNKFELFHLPLPKKETITGIIGRNGIGKSTALKILSGEIKPNLGKYSEKVHEEEILHKYSTNILGDYFERLFKNEIKISYKPQRIELIPKAYSGTVRELIDKVDEKGIGENLAKELKLKLDEGIRSLSGGELQKLAIIATICKKADVYYFDEPASYLDVTTRIKAAKLIRKLSDEKVSVIVVEHDLATLDYISDEIQVIYGEPAGYGILSVAKSVRRGINEYLEGYLPEDNVRFRDYEIKFNLMDIKKEVSSQVLLEYGDLEKRYPGFNLKINSGKIHKKEVMSVMGANGLGKTTFLKMLAGIEKPDKGEVGGFKISYKSQYLEPEENTVEGYLRNLAGPDFDSGWYKQNILEKLNLGKLLQSPMEDLSGGELQKVLVSGCLSKDADIYALDEPSAFIDVEDRLKVAEVIKEFVVKKEKCAIVVDHDVQFIDYIGDSMLVFEGESGVKGDVFGPCDKKEGMNRVLKMLDITYRHDRETLRPRINKPGSQLDKTQREKGEFYYN